MGAVPAVAVLGAGVRRRHEDLLVPSVGRVEPQRQPGIADYGYVVSWGSQTDPYTLADWNTNPNHTALPGQAGYLAAPAGERADVFTSSLGWGGASINATVVTALRYTDPSAGDQRTYKSTAFYKVDREPREAGRGDLPRRSGRLPLVIKSGADLQLTWPAIAGAAAYHIRVWNLATKLEIACPAGLDCQPTGSTTLHSGAGSDASGYGYRVTAVDACGTESAD